MFMAQVAMAQVTIVPTPSTWQHLITTSDPSIGFSWRTDTINTWSTTASSPISLTTNKTTYFRQRIKLPSSNPVFATYKLSVKRDDGVVVYVNGQEVYRNNLNSPYGYSTPASAAGDNGAGWQEVYLDGRILKGGGATNVIAAEVHKYSTSTDLYFDLKLEGFDFLQFIQNDLISNGDTWKYLDTNTRPASWEQSSFDDSGWQWGSAELGYGDGDETTVVNGGPIDNRYITTYFRKTFTTGTYDYYRMRIRRDDGIVVYFNGIEVFRDNILGDNLGVVTHSTLASVAISDYGESEWHEIFLKSNTLHSGSNTIAAEIHQSSSGSSDISFNLELIGMNASTTYITRGPYLQMLTQIGDGPAEIHWQTNVPTTSEVGFGTLANYPSYDGLVDNTATTDHVMHIPNYFIYYDLPGYSKIFYSVGSVGGAILQKTSDNYFLNLPFVGAGKKTRILAMGDMGDGDQPQRLVMDKFTEYVKD